MIESFIPEYMILLLIFIPFLIALGLVLLHWLSLARNALEEGRIRIDSMGDDLMVGDEC